MGVRLLKRVRFLMALVTSFAVLASGCESRGDEEKHAEKQGHYDAGVELAQQGLLRQAISQYEAALSLPLVGSSRRRG